MLIRSMPQPLDWAKIVYSVALWAVLFWVALATAQAATITLAWNTSTGATGYRVYQAETNETAVNLSTTHVTDASPVVANLTGTTTTPPPTTATVTVAEGKTHYFAVKAYNDSSTSGFSNETGKTVPAATPAPVASFSASPTTGNAPLTVKFTDSSTNATAWSWNFGDGTTSTAQNPSKIYSAAGSYTVTLTATGPSGSNTATRTNYITVAPAPPVASCAISTTSATTSTTITYTGSSSGGSVATWSWNFNSSFSGSGSGSTVIGNYTNPGTYTASVTATGSGGSSTATCPSVTVTAAPPVASFSASSTNGSAPLTVTFTNASTGTAPLTYAWTFGDGSTSNERDPSHSYATTGTFPVNLTVTDGNNRTATAQPVSITVAAASANNGLVAAYNFQEATGTVVVDESGNGNHGTLSCNTAVNSACTVTARSTSGKFGKALSFDGVDDWVTVNHSASLNLTTGMTLEAWVYPTAVTSMRAVLIKEQSGPSGIYYLLANTWSNQGPTAIVDTGYEQAVSAGTMLGLNQWTHLAATYDGQYERLYINGTQVAEQPHAGTMISDTGALRIGGSSAWGAYFQGGIDEIRVYNRVLSASEIQTDKSKSVVTKLLVGNSSTTGSVTDEISQNVAQAFKKAASVSGKVTSLRIYVNSGSTSTRLVAGLYADNNGHPGALRAQGALNNPKASAWNTVPLTAAYSVNKGETYWLAILSPSGILKFRDKVGGAAEPSETSAETNLTSLPNPWTGMTTGINEGPLAGYGAGN